MHRSTGGAQMLDKLAILEQHIIATRAEKFAWGEHDCGMWVADYIIKIGGDDFAHDLRGQYHNAESLRMRLRLLGCKDLKAYCDRYLMPRASVSLAQRGDIVLYKNMTLGICAGRLSYCLDMLGNSTVNTLSCIKAWEAVV